MAVVIRKRLHEQPGPGRLGRHYHFDDRSLRYLHPEQDPKTLTSVQHTRQIPVLDQGNVGSCTGNAMVGALGTDPTWTDLAAGRPTLDEKLALSIYSKAEIVDGDGPYPPNDNGSSGLSVCTVARTLGYISGWSNATTLNAALTALASGPEIVGMKWLTGCDSPNKVGRITYAGSLRGGHEIVFDTLDVEQQLVWFTNSWGTTWGVQGRACLSWSDFGKALADEGDCILPIPVTTPAPTPTPVPGPQADQALWAQVKGWTLARHVGSNKAAAKAVTAWASSKGFQ